MWKTNYANTISYLLLWLVSSAMAICIIAHLASSFKYEQNQIDFNSWKGCLWREKLGTVNNSLMGPNYTLLHFGKRGESGIWMFDLCRGKISRRCHSRYTNLFTIGLGYSQKLSLTYYHFSTLYLFHCIIFPLHSLSFPEIDKNTNPNWKILRPIEEFHRPTHDIRCRF